MTEQPIEKTPEQIKKEMADIQHRRNEEMRFLEKETRYFKCKADYYEEYLRMINVQSEFMQLQKQIQEYNTSKDEGQGSSPEPQSE